MQCQHTLLAEANFSWIPHPQTDHSEHRRDSVERLGDGVDNTLAR